jgi:hypothetical protein
VVAVGSVLAGRVVVSGDSAPLAASVLLDPVHAARAPAITIAQRYEPYCLCRLLM